MEEQKIKEIATLLSGLKRYEWSKIKVAVEKMYDSASCKLTLDDAESIQKNIKLEFGSFANNQYR